MKSSANASPKMLKAIARRWIEEGWTKGNADIVDELHAPDFVDRDPSGRKPTSTAFKDAILEVYTAFPDFKCSVEDLVVEPAPQRCPGEVAGKVAVRWSATGTHKGTYLNASPTGKKITFKGIEIITIKNGKITERWGEWDGIDLLQQLGAI